MKYDKSKLKLVSENKNEHYHIQSFLISTKNNDSEIIEKYLITTLYPDTKEYYETVKTFKQQKFLCVNGPKMGQKITRKEGGEFGYYHYNCGEDGYREESLPRCVLITFN